MAWLGGRFPFHVCWADRTGGSPVLAVCGRLRCLDPRQKLMKDSRYVGTQYDSKGGESSTLMPYQKEAIRQ